MKLKTEVNAKMPRRHGAERKAGGFHAAAIPTGRVRIVCPGAPKISAPWPLALKPAHDVQIPFVGAGSTPARITSSARRTGWSHWSRLSAIFQRSRPGVRRFEGRHKDEDPFQIVADTNLLMDISLFIGPDIYGPGPVSGTGFHPISPAAGSAIVTHWLLRVRGRLRS